MANVQNQGYALDTTWRTVLKDLGVKPANVLRRAGLPDDLLQQPIPITGGAARVPDGPGLGVALNDEKVERYRVGK